MSRTIDMATIRILKLKLTCLCTVTVNVKKVFIKMKLKDKYFCSTVHRWTDKHTSGVPFVTVWRFAAIHKRQEASTQTLKIYIGRIRDWC
jgi:hypothetical protein